MENHRTLPVSTEYILDGLYPNTMYHVWLAAKSKRGEGAATTPVAVKTEQYGKLGEFSVILSALFKFRGRYKSRAR